MKTFLKLTILGLVMLGLIAGCGKAPTVQNINNSDYFAKAQAKSAVAKAIKRGASSKGWRTKAIKDGLIEANIWRYRGTCQNIFPSHSENLFIVKCFLNLVADWTLSTISSDHVPRT